jgi:hypothetical protein
VKIVSNWVDEAKKSLEAGDKIEKTYPCKLNGESGYLALSDKKLQFIVQKGFLSKTYSKKYEVAYGKIKKLDQKNLYTIELLDGDNAARDFNFNELPAHIVLQSLNQLMQAAH